MVVFDVYNKWMLAALECLGFVAFTRYEFDKQSEEEKAKKKKKCKHNKWIQTVILYIFSSWCARTPHTQCVYKNRTAWKLEEVKKKIMKIKNRRHDQPATTQHTLAKNEYRKKRHSAQMNFIMIFMIVTTHGTQRCAKSEDMNVCRSQNDFLLNSKSSKWTRQSVHVQCSHACTHTHTHTRTIHSPSPCSRQQ